MITRSRGNNDMITRSTYAKNKNIIGSTVKKTESKILIKPKVTKSTIKKNQSNSEKNFIYSKCQLEDSKRLLHTSQLPDILLKRENECKSIRQFIINCIKRKSDPSSRVLCISGIPGTGKTASVLKVLKDLIDAKTYNFRPVIINGLEYSDPKLIFPMVFKAVNKGITGAKKKISPREAQNRLNEHFSSEQARRIPMVIFIDEVDMLYTKREEVIYTIFNWTVQDFSRCCVIAISNTLDLAERKFSQRVVSRIGSNRLIFQPYEYEEIEAIFQHRVERCISEINPKVIELIAKKIASVSGDLRKAFELMRRAIDLAIYECEQTGKNKAVALLETKHVIEAIKESTTSLRMDFVKSLSKHEELLFRSIILNLHESALEDTIFSRVLIIYKKLCISEGLQPLSLDAAYHHLEELSFSHLIIISFDRGHLHCRIRLGFPLSEAQFCIRQLDLEQNN